MRRAADIISYSSSERKSMCDACWWSKLFNVTGSFTACIDANSPTVKVDNPVWLSLRSTLL